MYGIDSNFDYFSFKILYLKNIFITKRQNCENSLLNWAMCCFIIFPLGEILSQCEISFLPPLLLNFDLPEDYPSSSPPSFTLTCSWLSHTQVIFNLYYLGQSQMDIERKLLQRINISYISLFTVSSLSSLC